VCAAHFVSDSSKKSEVRIRMGQGDFVLKMRQNWAKKPKSRAFVIAVFYMVKM